MLRRFLLIFCVLLPGLAKAADAPSRPLPQELLALAGTAAIFDSAKVQAALADPQPFLGDAGRERRLNLLQEAGLKAWQPPRVWLLQSRKDGDVEHWDNVGQFYAVQAQARGYSFLNVVPLPGAEQAIGLLQPGKSDPALAALLAAYGADALVLIRGQEWSLWTGAQARQGQVPGQRDMLPDVLAESLAALQQWPEAGGQPVVQVQGVGGLAEFAAVQTALAALPGVQQLRLIRVEPRQVWFTLAAPSGDALSLALDGDARLPASAAAHGSVALPVNVLYGERLACPLMRRQWLPEAGMALSGTEAAPVQSAPPRVPRP
jgi:hypothetical protein